MSSEDYVKIMLRIKSSESETSESSESETNPLRLQMQQLRELELELDIKTAELLTAMQSAAILTKFEFGDLVKSIGNPPVLVDRDEDHEAHKHNGCDKCQCCQSRLLSTLAFKEEAVPDLERLAEGYFGARREVLELLSNMDWQLRLTRHWLLPAMPSCQVHWDAETSSLTELASFYPFKDAVCSRLTWLKSVLSSGLTPDDFNCYRRGLCGGRRGCTREVEHKPWTPKFWLFASQNVQNYEQL